MRPINKLIKLKKLMITLVKSSFNNFYSYLLFGLIILNNLIDLLERKVAKNIYYRIMNYSNKAETEVEYKMDELKTGRY